MAKENIELEERKTVQLTTELYKVMEHIRDEIVNELPTSKIQPVHFILSVFETPNCIAYTLLNRILVTDTLNMLRDWSYETAVKNTPPQIPTEQVPLGDLYVKSMESAAEKVGKDGQVDSGTMLVELMKHDKDLDKQFKNYGITEDIITPILDELLTDESAKEERENVGKKEKKKNEKQKDKSKSHTVEQVRNKVLDEHLINLTDMARMCAVDEVYGNEDIITDIFNRLSRRDANNVLLLGDVGVGKTATAKHIANLLVRGDAPKVFKKCTMYELDPLKLMMGAAYKGVVESKFKAILYEASKMGNCIIFIDNLPNILSPYSKFSEVPNSALINMLLEERSIMVVATATYEGYSKHISDEPSTDKLLQKVKMNEKTIDESASIIKHLIHNYSTYHGVRYTDDIIMETCKLSKRFFSNVSLPMSAINVLDETGATIRANRKESKNILKVRVEIEELNNELQNLNMRSAKEYEENYDSITRKIIAKKSELTALEKAEVGSSKPTVITIRDIHKTIADKIGIPIGEIGLSELEKLKGLSDTLKANVIGQDEAVDKLSKIVRRQRVGLSNPNKPASVLCVGATGVGKTYISKKLAEAVFGSETNIVRLDMSEYSDKISVNKLTGSAAGYVGYDEGGVLTEAIKRNNRCVLLLDEIEKANEEVFNVFLQVFDEGRLTDNKGVTVDFKNVIIIMTSNVGVKEAIDKPSTIGFGHKDEEAEKKDIIIKSIKKKFKPEFINRIDDIIYFNSLTDDNLKAIIRNEVKKVAMRLESLGYSFDESITDGKMCDDILAECIKEKEYGARPVLREIQRQLEDKVTDLILDGGVEKGHVFTYEEVAVA